ncbi:MAG: TRAP transporter substrate-binding protein DctP [Proteobacteria bacterium]|nr:TRAP transporter substrate-binding protein DctP [Pseudomonadota bacterium]
MLARRRILQLAAGALVAPALVRGSSAEAPISLKLHHGLAPTSNIHRKILQPWAERIATASGGRLAIEIFAAMHLGGAPRQLYDQARDATVDLAFTALAQNPGRFMRAEVFELPFFGAPDSPRNTAAFAEYVATHAHADFADVRVICACVQDHRAIHARVPIGAASDLKGLRLHAQTQGTREALRLLGATPLAFPLSQVPESLRQNVIDGCVLSFELVPAIKIEDLARFHTQLAVGPAMSTAAHVLAMNRARYDALPADLRGLVDTHSGAEMAATIARMWDAQAAAAAASVRGRGNVIAALSAPEALRWRRASAPAIAAWAGAARARGIDADPLLAAARELIEKHAKA